MPKMYGTTQKGMAEFWIRSHPNQLFALSDIERDKNVSRRAVLSALNEMKFNGCNIAKQGKGKKSLWIYYK